LFSRDFKPEVPSGHGQRAGTRIPFCLKASCPLPFPIKINNL
jgi:hypothetical protein